MNIVIPMAGHGSRFRNAGIQTPKPLIEVGGIPMYARATLSLPLHLSTQLIFIVLSEQLDSGLYEEIMERFADFDTSIFAIDQPTRGQAETVFLAQELLGEDDPLMIFNSDTEFRSPLGSTIEALDSTVSGIVTVFPEQDPRWSFARIDEQGRIVEIAEKNPISSWATAGLYYFCRGGDFLRLAERAIESDQRSNGEFYVGPLYNQLIAEGGVVIPDYAEEVGCMGTPEDLNQYNKGFRFRGEWHG